MVDVIEHVHDGSQIKVLEPDAAALKGRCISMSYPAETDRFFLLILVPDGNVGHLVTTLFLFRTAGKRHE